MSIETDRDRLIHILVVHYDMFRHKAEEAADLFLHDKVLAAAKVRAIRGDGELRVDDELCGWIAYELTRRIVIDMPTARAAVDGAVRRLEDIPPPRHQASARITDATKPSLRETMWATVIFEGEDDSFRFELNEEGNRDGVHYDRSIEFAADTFPIGTKIVVYEPDEEADEEGVGASEAQLKTVSEALTSLLAWAKFELGPEMAAKQPWAGVIAKSEAALATQEPS